MWLLQVLGLTTAVGVIRGTSSAEFAIALIFSMVVMYDASGVRLHAGKTASVLNMIITELPPDHPVSDTRPLRDTLGHTPLQARRPAPACQPATPRHWSLLTSYAEHHRLSDNYKESRNAVALGARADCGRPVATCMTQQSAAAALCPPYANLVWGLHLCNTYF